MSLVKSLIGLFNRRSVRVGLFLALLGLILALPHLSRAGRQGSNSTNTQKRHNSHSVPGEILVRFKESSPATKTAKTELLIAQDPTNLTIDIEQLAGTEVVSGLRLARVAPAETQRAIGALRARSDVLYAEPNYIRRKDNVPNDARYGDLWGLKNTGQGGGVAGTDIKAEQAWDVTTGSRNIVVAVIDEGIDVQHQDLQPNIWRNSGEVAGNGVDDDANGFIDDVNGYDFYHNDGSVYDGPGVNPDDSEVDAHGTHVAGTIGAQGNNGSGVVGVNWQVSLMSLKFLGPDGGSSADVIRAYGYVKTMRERWINSGGTLGANIRVTNNSYGGSGYSQAEADAIQAMGSVGTLFVASAGNDSEDNNLTPSYPASYDLSNLITVASIDRNGSLSGFSNRGSRTAHLVAPGRTVLSTTPGNNYEYFNGTSMAAPHVTGTAALVLAAHGDFNVARLRGAVLFGGQPSALTDSNTITGRLLSAAGALQNAVEADSVAPAAVGNLTMASQADRAVSLSWTAPGDDGNAGQASLYEIRFIDAVTNARFLLATIRPGVPGTVQSADLNIPYQHSNGVFQIRTLDNAGNTSETSINASVGTPEAVDPYLITIGPAEPLTTGGSPLGMPFDDYRLGFGMPFNFPFFESYYGSISVSTNGVIYLGPPPVSDAFNNEGSLNGRLMIAGMWDDLDLRPCFRNGGDVYRVTPDNDRIIYRWEGVRFDSPVCPATPTGALPVNFEIELRRDGTIKKRYGQNTPLFPVVGIGGGEPEGYLIDSHSSTTTTQDLTNAQTITYTLRRLPKQTDLLLTSVASNLVLIGQDITFNLTATNRGPNRAPGVNITNTIPNDSAFVSCTSSQGSCSGLSNGKVQINLGLLESGGTANVAIVVRATGNNGHFINQATITSPLSEVDLSNNSASSFVQVITPNQNPQTGIVGLGAGSHYSFGIRSDGYALAWGANHAGQLGDGSISEKKIPVRINNLRPVTSIDGGAAHSLAIKGDGSVWAWGQNDLGQVGDGTTLNRKTPTRVNGLSGAIRISAGGTHSLALRNDGTVWAWGNNERGQLGDGTTTNRLQPVQVTGLSDITSISAGFNHSLAVKSDGTVWAWGGNESGQLGDSTNLPRNTPVQLTGISNVSKVFASDSYTFFGPGGLTTVTFSVALRGNGTVWTWGHNWRGQLGDGTTNNRSTPGQVAGLTNVTSIAAGGFHVIVLRSDGTVWSWGGNFSGQLGDLTTNDRYTPGQVVWLSGVQEIVAGTEHSLALRQDGHILGWGSYSNGQLGFGGSVGHLVYPYEVSMHVPDPPAIGTVTTPVFSPPSGTFGSPQNVVLRSTTGDESISSFYIGGRHNFVRLSTGGIHGWGSNSHGQLGTDPGYPFADPTKTVVKTPVLMSALSNVANLSIGGAHNVVLKTDGTVWTSGGNSQGELGYLTNSQPRAAFSQVPGVTGVTAVSASGGGAVVLKTDGTVWAWGSGPINSDSPTFNIPPVQVNGLANVVSIESGAASFAIRNDGTLWAWGNNSQGILGDGTETGRPAPVQITALSNVTAVSSGGSHTIALKSDGTVWTWGNNTYGQLGLGNDFSGRLSPAQVPGLTGVIRVEAGFYHNLALKSDGTVWAWGENFHGELGDGTNNQRRSPVKVSGIPAMSSIGAGFQHSAAMTSDGNLFVWGMNDFGQVGDGTTDNQFGPVALSQLTGGVKIHYTTNGVDPTDNDPFLVSGAAISINQTTVLKARAYKEGWTPSGIATATYTLTPQGGPIQLANASYSISESGGVASVNVSRTGDSSVAAAVDYATTDTAGLNNCHQVNGIASSRCDYATSVGTVRFDVGQSSKSISIPIVDDAYAEGSETFTIILRNPAGGSLGSTTTASVTITDNETSNGTNPLDQTPFFVRQQYVDFLGREPDPGGFAAWQNVINNCPAGSTDCDRIHVSSGFFRSPEFQGRGYFVYRFYPVAFGRKPEYVEFIPDLAKVSGFLSDTELEAARVAFITEFMSRPAFVTKFNGLSDTQYVDMLLATAGITHTARDFWIGSLGNGTRTRAEVLREIAESTEVYNKYYNQAFVVMQYFGYLRRDPDALYLNWIQVLDTTDDFRGMVNGFMNSSEYRFRFGP